MGYPYKEVFQKLEQSLIEYGSAHRPKDEIRAALEAYKHQENRAFSDGEYYATLVDVAFYSGFRAATVEERHARIYHWFGDYQAVADYGEKEVTAILTDPGMIRNRRKIEACVANAKVMRDLVAQYGSFRQYIDSFRASESFENLLLLKEELEAKFRYLGGITVYHFLMEIGMGVLKPDRVIGRIFHRLGLTDHEEQYLKTVTQGRKFAQATHLPIRYIDIVFVSYGQARFTEFGIDRGICLAEPRCDVCGITEYCHEFQKRRDEVMHSSRPARPC